MSEASWGLAGYELHSPLVNAAGSVNGTSEENIIREVTDLADTGIGAITWGSITIPEQAGKGIWQYDPETKEMYNFMGLPNVGEARGLKLLPKLLSIAHEKGKPLNISVSPTHSPEHGTSIQQAVRLAHSFLEGGADMVEINGSCPHIGSSESVTIPIMGYDLEAVDELNEELYFHVGSGHPLGFKPPPELKPYHEAWLDIKVPDYLKNQSEDWLPSAAKILRGRNVFRFIVASNTIPNQKEIQGHMASLSGGSRRVKIIGRQQLLGWYQELDDAMDVVSVLGVDSGKEGAYRMMAGAVAIGGVTFLWRGKAYKPAVTRMLEELAEEA